MTGSRVFIIAALLAASADAGSEAPKRPSVQLGSAIVESLDQSFREAVESAIGRSLPEISSCYARARQQKRDLECSLMFNMDIDNGQVSSIRVEDLPSDERHASLETLSVCSREVLKRIHFPAKKETTVTRLILLFNLR